MVRARGSTMFRAAIGLALGCSCVGAAIGGTGRVPIGADPDDRIARGRELFHRVWAEADPRSRGGDGLGPMFNARSCVACHGQAAPGGAGPIETNVEIISVTKGSGPAPDDDRKWLARLHPAFRDATAFVLHRRGTDPGYDAWRAGFLGNMLDATDKLPARAQWGKFTVARSQRNPPPLFGAGLIDAVPDEVLLEQSRRSDPRYPEARGRVSRLPDGRIGRFGWKAQIVDLREFTLSACAGELGLEVPGHHQATDPQAPDRKAPGLDMTAEQCDDLVAFLGSLPAPITLPPVNFQRISQINDGRRIFAQAGCAACHTPDLGPARGLYSDLLLHDMGSNLSDGGQYYGSPQTPTGPGGELLAARPQEWRTPPLWGLRDTGPYLHDGRAETVEAAIKWHDGEGGQAARRFAQLGKLERSRLLQFLHTLAAPARPGRGRS